MSALKRAPDDEGVGRESGTRLMRREPSVLDQRLVDIVAAEGALEEVADAAPADEQIEEALPPGRALEEAVEPGHLAGRPGLAALPRRALVEAGGRDQDEPPEALGLEARGPGQELARQGQRQGVDRLLVALISGDHVEHVEDRVDIELGRVAAVRSIGEAEARQVWREDTAIAQLIVVDRLHLEHRARGVDAVQQQQRRALAVDIVAEPAGAAVDLQPLAAHRCGQQGWLVGGSASRGGQRLADAAAQARCRAETRRGDE